ncbi:MAG: 50S ribosomal protein L21 [Rhodospirillales bacterium]|nr:50S ribosomal protein L21 [Rhodospirillales bacterium]
MYAVIKTGGKQYKVAKNDVIVVEKLPATVGTRVEFDQVLMVGDTAKRQIGTPVIAGALVTATVLNQGKGDKILVFKKKRRQNYRRKNGHRQFETVLRIAGIYTDGEKPGPAEAPAEIAKPAAKVAKAPAKPAAKKAAAKAKPKAAKAKKAE